MANPLIQYIDLRAENAALHDELLQAVSRVIQHGQMILGPEVAELEQQLAQRLGVPRVIGVANGTDALVLALRAAGVGPGDEVITVSHSFVATASSIMLLGATPVFVDVDDDTMLMDPKRLPAALTKKTKAVLPVHLNGTPCAMDEITRFCREHGLGLVEDCAQAIDAQVSGRKVGGFGIGAFSLHPLKIFGALGDAGFVTASTPEQAAFLEQARNIGLKDRDTCLMVSGNSRLDTLHAALLLVKLRQLDAWHAQRAVNAAAYRAALGDLLRFDHQEAGQERVYSCFAVRHPRRDHILTAARAAGVDLKVHYPKAIHQQPAFAGLRVPPLPVTERVVSEIFSLPVRPQLTVGERDQVIAAIRGALR